MQKYGLPAEIPRTSGFKWLCLQKCQFLTSEIITQLLTLQRPFKRIYFINILQALLVVICVFRGRTAKMPGKWV